LRCRHLGDDGLDTAVRNEELFWHGEIEGYGVQKRCVSAVQGHDGIAITLYRKIAREMATCLMVTMAEYPLDPSAMSFSRQGKENFLVHYYTLFSLCKAVCQFFRKKVDFCDFLGREINGILLTVSVIRRVCKSEW
jgi:hypothetical protein